MGNVTGEYGYRTRGRTLALVPTPKFCKAYSEAMDGMVEKQFFDAAKAISSIWYTAWVDAGAPHLQVKLNVERGRSINELARFFQGLRKDPQELDEVNLLKY